jgi:hypothetical protein
VIQAWWYTALIPALRRLRQEHHKPGAHREMMSEKKKRLECLRLKILLKFQVDEDNDFD